MRASATGAAARASRIDPHERAVGSRRPRSPGSNTGRPRVPCRFVVCVMMLGATQALAQTSTPIARAQRFTGNINFVTTGGSLRSQSNATDACSLKNPQTSVQALSGIPANTTIQAVYLYWGHSGTTTDTSVTLN